ncbi:MAG: T9SS type A sorting domain-containing protein, partial [Cytophagales bacterium]
GGKKDSAVFDLTTYFGDINSDVLSFSTLVNNENIITSRLRGSKLTLYANQPGTTQVLVTAKDPENLSAAQAISAMVTLVTATEPSAIEERIQVSPNPAQSIVNLQYSLSSTSSVKIEVYDLQGRKFAFIEKESNPAGNHQLEYDCSALSDGV